LFYRTKTTAPAGKPSLPGLAIFSRAISRYGKIIYGRKRCQSSTGFADPRNDETDAARQLANAREARANSPHLTGNPSLPVSSQTLNSKNDESLFLFTARPLA
jgi:hypothetical protein